MKENASVLYKFKIFSMLYEEKNNNKYYPRFEVYVYINIYTDACGEQLQMSFMLVNSGSHLFHGVSIVFYCCVADDGER